MKKIIYKYNTNDIINKIILYTIIIINIYTVFFIENSVSNLKLIGTFIILTSLFLIYKYKNNNSISIITGTIALISISFAYSVCFNTYETAFNWQKPLVETKETVINVKNFLLFMTVLIFSIGNIKINKEKINSEFFKLKNQKYIIIVFIISLLGILIFGFDRGKVGTYTPNTNALYEYALIIYIFLWHYSYNNKLVRKFLILYSVLYCLQGLLFGDRSSAFPMILLVLMLNLQNKIKIKFVILLGLGGIFLANMIDIFRNTGNIISMTTLNEIINRGLFVNTISYAFYGGTQIIRFGNVLSFNEKIIHLMNYIVSIFIGKSNKYSLTVIANSSGYINKGGGISHNYYYFWGGIIGIIIFAIIIGRIINYVFNNDTKINNILKITISIFTIRWFLYYPVAFFRTALLVPIMVYMVLKIINIKYKK